MSDLSDIEVELRQLKITFEEVYAPNGNDVVDVVAVVYSRGEEFARVHVGRAENDVQLRKALDRLSYYLVDALP